MNRERFRWKTSIDRWLEIATARLCDEAAARVRREIMAHYQAAFDEGRAAGKSVRRAAKTAIVGLGDPFRAARVNRRTYLTEQDRQFVEDVNQPTHRKGITYTTIFLVLLLINFPWISGLILQPVGYFLEQLFWCAAGLLLAEVTLILVYKALHNRILCRTNPLDAAPRLIVLGWIATTLGLSAFFFMLRSFIAHPFSATLSYIASISFMFLITLNTALRIRGKIHKNESPSPLGRV